MDKDIVMKSRGPSVEVNREICGENKETVLSVLMGRGPVGSQEWGLREDGYILPLKSAGETGKDVSSDFEKVPSNISIGDLANLGMVIKTEDFKVEADQQPEGNGETGPDLIAFKTNEKISMQENKNRLLLTLNDEPSVVADSFCLTSSFTDKGSTTYESGVNFDKNSQIHSLPGAFSDETIFSQRDRESYTSMGFVERMDLSNFKPEDSKWTGTIIKDDRYLSEACCEPKQPVPYALGLTTATQQDRGSDDTASAVVESTSLSSSFKSGDLQWIGTIINDDRYLSEVRCEPKQPVPYALGLTTATQQDRGSDDTASAVVESTSLSSSFKSGDLQWIGTIINDDRYLSEVRCEPKQPVSSALGLTTPTQQDRGSHDTSSAVVESTSLSSSFKSEDSKWTGTIINEDRYLSEVRCEPKQPVSSALGLTTATQQDRGSHDTSSAVIESTSLPSSFKSEDSKWTGTIINEDRYLSEVRCEPKHPVSSALGLTTSSQQDRGSVDTSRVVVGSTSLSSSFKSEDLKWSGTIIKEDKGLSEARYEHEHPVSSAPGLSDLGGLTATGHISQISERENIGKHHNTFRNLRDQNHPGGGETSAHSCSKQNICEVCEKRFSLPSEADAVENPDNHHPRDELFSECAEVSCHEATHVPSKPLCLITDFSTATDQAVGRVHSDCKACKCQVCPLSITKPSDPNLHQRVHSRTKPYKCVVCSKQFSKSSDLHKHGRVHSGTKACKCDICFKQFSTSSYLKTHQRVYSGSKPYMCEVCSRQFKTLAELKTHQSVHSGSKPYMCDVCSKQFSRSSYLKAHQRVHSGSKPYMCDVCSKQFSTSSYLKTHQRVHSDSKPYKCDVCSKQFSRSTNLKAHDIVHSGSRPYKCDVCSKLFSNSSNLKAHGRRNHSGSKPYKSDVRSKQFSTSSYLNKAHQRVHSDSKPYKCYVCSKQFSQSSSLKAHERRVHSGIKPYLCEVCSKQCSTAFELKVHKIASGNLKVHKRVHSGSKPYMCDVCSKHFSTSSCVRRHERIHSGSKPYKCDICSKQFSESGNLKVHKRVHSGSKPYLCDVCSNQFSTSSELKVHKRVHSGSKPYKCDVCSKQFSRSSDLNVHKRVHSGSKPYKCDVCSKQFSTSSNLRVHKRVHSDSIIQVRGKF